MDRNLQKHMLRPDEIVKRFIGRKHWSGKKMERGSKEARKSSDTDTGLMVVKESGEE